MQFAWRIADAEEKTWVFWIHAASRARVEEAFQDIAHKIKLRGRKEEGADTVRLVSHWLADKRNGKWVMIIDSADDYDLFYKKPEDGSKSQPLASYFPQCSHGRILITTRNNKLGSALAGGRQNVIEVGVMNSSEAFSLLEMKLGSISDADRETASELIDELDRIPLAITQAGAYITYLAPMMSLGQYLAEFREGEYQRNSLLEHTSDDIRRDIEQSNAVLGTGLMSIEQIYREQRRAIDLLSLMSFFDPQGIPASILQPTGEEMQRTGAGGLLLAIFKELV